MALNYRIGVDLGTASLGWAIVELNRDDAPIKLIAAGSRIFSDGRDPKSESSLAVDRRAARAMRRRRDRFKQRQAALLKHLTLAGLFPDGTAARQELAGLDPYELRARALHEALPLHHLGRAFFHLNQRRGFKSNRKTDRGKTEDDGKIRIGVARLQEVMREKGAATLGEYLHDRRRQAADPSHVPSVRTRLRPESGEGARGDGYDFYPDRRMLEDEFEAIWEAQQAHHGAVLTEEIRRRLFEVIFYQRPLKQPDIGVCTLVAPEKRLPKAHPLFQKRRLLEELNALRLVRPGEQAEKLSREQRDLAYLKLKDKRTVRFESLRKALKLDPDARFNKESENRTELKGDEVAAELGAKSRFGGRWGHIAPADQWEIVSRIQALESDEDEVRFCAWLAERYGLDPEQACAVAAARLPQGFGRFGLTATTGLITALQDEVIVYSEAVQKAGLGHHSDFRKGEVLAELPYYGTALERHIMPGTGDPGDSDEMRIGRVTNPTVHIGLNQLRRVVNRLIKRYGPPRQIAVELARELKLDDQRKREINTRNRQNREAAERRSQKLVDIRIADKGGNRALLKLWEELNPENALDRRCIYSGRQISIEMLFSGAVEVDHILPFAATLDDSNANKLLCLREANRSKRRRSPFEAFGHGADWEEIAARAARLPREKRWRFEPDAMARFDTEEKRLARQLVDTQYLSRLAREYLDVLFADKGEGSGRVWVSPGRLTEMLRRSWGLNHLLPDHNFGGGADQPKNRRDHRHHTVDAVVVAVTDRHLLQAIAREAGQRGHEAANRMTADLPMPWPDFDRDVGQVIRQVVVSHRADHGTVSKAGAAKGQDATAGRLHNDTAYGLTGEIDEKGNTIVVRRVPVAALKKPADLEGVRDGELRKALLAWTRGCDGKAFEARLSRFPELGPLQFRGIRRLRVVEPLTVIPVRDRNGRVYKGYKGDSNYRYDVWELKDGKWVAEVVSMFDAHQPSWTSPIRRENPTARKVLSLQQNDVVAIEAGGKERELMRVAQLRQGGQITLAACHEAGDLKRRDAESNEVDPFKYFSPTAGGLKRVRARQVRVDELGRVLDPGPRDRRQGAP